MRLRHLELKDAQLQLEWMHDIDVYSQFQQDFEHRTIQDVINFIENSCNDKHQHFAVVDDLDEYLGTVSLKNIDYVSSEAEYAIVVRKSKWGMGVGRFASTEIIKIANELRLNKVYLTVLEENYSAQYLYESIGFRHMPERDQLLQIRNRERLNRYYEYQVRKE